MAPQNDPPRPSPQQSKWQLAVINPSFILGPPPGPRADGESVNLVKRLLDGGLWPYAPPFFFGMVDVRDVAAAHVRALFYPSAGGKRFICSEVGGGRGG